MAPLNKCALGATFGLFFGLDLFLHAVFAMQNTSFWWWNPGTWGLYQQAFPWLQATWGSAFLGLLGGLICGAICGLIFGWVYNKVDAEHRCKLCK